MSKSWRNVLLIHMQMPHATMLADFKRWKEQYGRTVVKGSKTIKINAPIEQKSKKKTVEKIDPDTGAVMLDDKGRRIMEEVVIETPVQFKEVRLLDISQTEGKPVLRLAGDVVSAEALNRVFLDVLRGMMPQSANKDFDTDTPTEIFKDMKHLAIDRLGNSENGDFGMIGFIAASIAYVVCLRFGIEMDAGLVEFDRFTPSPIDGDILDVVCKQAEGFISTIEDRFTLLCKERELEPMTSPKQITPITFATTSEPTAQVEPETEDEPQKPTLEPALQQRIFGGC